MLRLVSQIADSGGLRSACTVPILPHRINPSVRSRSVAFAPLPRVAKRSRAGSYRMPLTHEQRVFAPAHCSTPKRPRFHPRRGSLSRSRSRCAGRGRGRQCRRRQRRQLRPPNSTTSCGGVAARRCDRLSRQTSSSPPKTNGGRYGHTNTTSRGCGRESRGPRNSIPASESASQSATSRRLWALERTGERALRLRGSVGE